MAKTIRRCIQWIRETAPGSIGDMLDLQLVDFRADKGDYWMRCQTADWMRNFSGTLHGGLCATILDQAMGVVAHCLKPGEGTMPTVQMEVDYHRPLIPGEEVLVKVHVVSVTRSLMTLNAEAMRAANPDKVCMSGSAIFFYKPAEPETKD